jgi:3-hydroxyisobutyrate dehydrogenase
MLRRAFSSLTRVGFVGTGRMGNPMAANLLKSGLKVRVFDTNPALVNNLVSQGAVAVKNLEEVVEDVEAVVTMLPETKHVEAVCRTLKAKAKVGTIFIDSSTIHPQASKKLAEELYKEGLHFLDAPVSGGVAGATAGTLTFMVGGDAAVYEKAKNLFAAMGKNLFYCGPHGAGLAAKICNNLSLAIQMVATAEALNLGVMMGADPKKLTEVMGVSTSNCWSLNTVNPVPGVLTNSPSSRNYEGGFATELMMKDIKIALETAQEVGAHLGLGKRSYEYYNRSKELGAGNKDFGYVYQVIKDKKMD